IVYCHRRTRLQREQRRRVSDKSPPSRTTVHSVRMHRRR
ncbi:hypothetical protein TSAR_016239, partial [Trichomalopsis sarcophagae]